MLVRIGNTDEMRVLDVHHSSHFVLQHCFGHVLVLGVCAARPSDQIWEVGRRITNLLACEEYVVDLALNPGDLAEVTLAKQILLNRTQHNNQGTCLRSSL